MLNINPLRTDIFCLPQRFSTFYQVLNNCDEKLTLTSLLAWKHNKIRFCSFKCCQKNPFSHQSTSRNKVWWGLEIWFFRHYRTIKHCFWCEICALFPPPPFFWADFLKGPQRFLLSKCVKIYLYSSVWCFRQKGTTHYEFFLGAICPIICFADSLRGS